MKRYNLRAEYACAGIDVRRPVHGSVLKIQEADNGEWVRYEDVLEFVEIADHANDPECYCNDLEDDETGSCQGCCLTCQFQDAIADFRRGN